MMNRFVLLSVIALLLSACQKDEGKRVLLIGIDGLQYEQLQAIPTPNIDRLTLTKAYAGGVQGTGTEQPTSSGPGWATLLTGVWASKHQVWSNALLVADYHYPSFMFRTKQAIPSLSLSAVMHWVVPYFVFFIQEVPTLDYLSLGGDESVAKQVVNRIANDKSDVIFAHLDAPDHAGHAFGFSPEHTQAVIDSDRYVGWMLDAVAQRQLEKPEEDWLIMVVTDHGREPVTGFGHGNQTREEKTAFIATNATALNDAFSYQSDGLLDNSFDGLYGYPSQADVTPTIFRHLGIPIQAHWNLDGVPLIGEIGVIRLMAQVENGGVLLQWINTAHSSEGVEIFKNGILIALLAAGETQFLDMDIEGDEISDIDYSVRANGLNSNIRVKVSD